ncbi:MAG: PT domain-containing protein [Candidatus Micrarchaeota archaeon]
MKIALLLILVFGIALFGCTGNGTENPTAAPTELPTEMATATPTELSTSTPTATEAPQATEQSSLKDCKSDFDCFIKASENCELAKMKHAYTTTFGTIKQRNELDYELKGMAAGKCIFYIKIGKITIEFPPEVPKETVDEQKAFYDKMAGRDGTCKFEKAELTALLERWRVGMFSLSTDVNEGDWAGAGCEGEYFSSSLG